MLKEWWSGREKLRHGGVLQALKKTGMEQWVTGSREERRRLMEILSSELVRTVARVIPRESWQVFWAGGGYEFDEFAVFGLLEKIKDVRQKEQKERELSRLARMVFRGSGEGEEWMAREVYSALGIACILNNRDKEINWGELWEVVEEAREKNPEREGGPSAGVAMELVRHNMKVGLGFWRLGLGWLPATIKGGDWYRGMWHELVRGEGRWSEKLRWLEKLLYVGGGEYMEERNRRVWEVHQGTGDGYYEGWGEASGEQYRQMVWLAKTYGFSADKPAGLGNERFHAWGGERLMDSEELVIIDRRESQFHVINSAGFSVRTGYEMEVPFEKWMWEVNEWMEDSLFQGSGLKHGLGAGSSQLKSYMENSPGPFHDFRTGEAVFRLYNRLGYIDMFKAAGGSIHFNVDFRNALGLSELVWGMILTGQVYNPAVEFRDNILQIYLAEGRKYIECKVFELITPHGFVWAWERLWYMSVALKAFQLLQQDAAPRDALYATCVGLARVWSEYSVGLAWLMRERKWGIATKYLADARVEKINGEIGQVYPTVSSRYDRNRMWEVETAGLVRGEDKWPNSVAYAHDLVDQVALGVKEILGRVEREASGELTEVAKGGYERKAMVAYLTKYNLPRPNGSTQEDLELACRRSAWAMGVGEGLGKGGGGRA